VTGLLTIAVRAERPVVGAFGKGRPQTRYPMSGQKGAAMQNLESPRPVDDWNGRRLVRDQRCGRIAPVRRYGRPDLTAAGLAARRDHGLDAVIRRWEAALPP
jgi:hypothetical protein